MKFKLFHIIVYRILILVLNVDNWCLIPHGVHRPDRRPARRCSLPGPSRSVTVFFHGTIKSYYRLTHSSHHAFIIMLYPLSDARRPTGPRSQNIIFIKNQNEHPSISHVAAWPPKSQIQSQFHAGNPSIQTLSRQ